MLIRLLRYARAYRGRFLAASAFSVLNKVFDLAPPLLIGAAVDVVDQREDSFLAGFGFPDPVDQIYLLAGITVVVWALESIAQYLAERGPDAPIVVHLCGKFHSDYGLGTVSRFLRRRPGSRVAVVSTVGTSERGRSLEERERELGDFVWFVPAGD